MRKFRPAAMRAPIAAALAAAGVAAMAAAILIAAPGHAAPGAGPAGAVVMARSEPGPRTPAETIRVAQPWARPVTEGRPGAAYMEIANAGGLPDRLVGARSAAFRSASLHETVEQAGVVSMRPVPAATIAPGETLRLEPGGMHLMLFGARTGFAEGSEIPLVLLLERAGEVEVSVRVGAAPPGQEAGHGHQAGAHGGHGEGGHDEGEHGQHGKPGDTD